MSTVICTNCSKPWMDFKYSACPHCATKPKSGGEEEASISRSEADVADKLGARPAAESRMPSPSSTRASNGQGGLSSEQADRIITLLESRSTRRVDVAQRAEQASNVMSNLALLVLIIGAFGAALSVVAMVKLGFFLGLLYLGVVTVSTALYWGMLTTASVVAGYVANRST